MGINEQEIHFRNSLAFVGGNTATKMFFLPDVDESQ